MIFRSLQALVLGLGLFFSSTTVFSYELVIGGEQDQPWEAYQGFTDGPHQNGYMVQSFSQGTSSDVNCALCVEGELHSAVAMTVDELMAASPTMWSGLYARDGDHVIRIYADGRNNPDNGVGGGAADGSYSKRAELSDNRTDAMFSNGDERFYTLSFWAPSDIWGQPVKGSTVISQWKQFGGGNPNFEVRLSQAGDYYLSFRSVENNVPFTGLGYAKPDEWNDLKYYLKHSTSSNGLLKIWLNGNLVYSYEGRTLYKSGEDGYIKFGLYTELRDERTLLFDAIRIENAIGEKTLEQWVSDQADKPSVELIEPSDGDGVINGELVTLKANAIDPSGRQLRSEGGIASVSFYADGVLLGTDNSAPYEFNWMPPEGGLYSLTAKAIDTDSNEVLSAPVSLSVGNRPPSVSVTSPIEYDNLTLGQEMTISALAADADGSVLKVAFYVDGVLIGEDETSPYSMTWIPQVKSGYVLTARAIDDDSDVAAASLTVTAGAEITSTTQEANKDASVYSKYPDETNNYSRVSIRKSDYDKAGVFGFNLSVPEGTQVVDAKLRLQADELNGPVIMGVYSAIGDWLEDSVTWRTRPDKGETLLDQVALNAAGTLVLDVTSHVRQQHDQGADALTFWVTDELMSGNQIYFNSHATSQPPELELTLRDVPISQLVPDETKPSAPTELQYKALATPLHISWQAGADNVGIVDYLVHVNDELLKVVEDLSLLIDYLDQAIDNEIYVVARDLYGNTSDASEILFIAANSLDALDSDGDGVINYEDLCSDTPSSEIADSDGCGPSQKDSDGDGVNDAMDAFPNDGSETIDSDGDGIGNNADTDDDGDGVLDVNDAYPRDPSRWQVQPAGYTLDVDGDSDVDANDGVMIQRRLTGAGTVTTNIALPTDAGGSGVNQARTNSEIVAAVDAILHLCDVDGDGDADANDGVMIQRRLTGAGTVVTNIALPAGVGGLGAAGARTNIEIVELIDSLRP